MTSTADSDHEHPNMIAAAPCTPPQGLALRAQHWMPSEPLPLALREALARYKKGVSRSLRQLTYSRGGIFCRRARRRSHLPSAPTAILHLRKAFATEVCSQDL